MAIKRPFNGILDSLGPREILLGLAVFILILPYTGIFGGEVAVETDSDNTVTEFEAYDEDDVPIDDANEYLEGGQGEDGQDQ